MALNIIKVFNSLQGEGAYSGQQAIFLRLANCNLSCKFCDTEYKQGAIILHEDDIALRILGLYKESEFPIGSRLNLVVTGGEPALQSLAPLFTTLRAKCRARGINTIRFFTESNGILFKPWEYDTHLTISPKTPVNKLHPEALRHCSVLKFLWGRNFPKFFMDLPDFMGEKDMYIQPVEEYGRQKNTEEAVSFCLHNPKFKLSLQIHKQLNLE